VRSRAKASASPREVVPAPLEAGRRFAVRHAPIDEESTAAELVDHGHEAGEPVMT